MLQPPSTIARNALADFLKPMEKESVGIARQAAMALMSPSAPPAEPVPEPDPYGKGNVGLAVEGALSKAGQWIGGYLSDEQIRTDKALASLAAPPVPEQSATHNLESAGQAIRGLAYGMQTPDFTQSKETWPETASRSVLTGLARLREMPNIYLKDPEDIAKLEQNLNSPEYAPSPEFQKFMQAEGAFGWATEFARHPIKIATELIGSTLLSSLPSMALGTVGGLIGGGRGAQAGIGIGSAAVEGAGEFIDVLAQSGVDTQNAEALRAAFKDEELMERAWSKAFRKGATVGLVDAATAARSFAIAGARGRAANELMEVASRGYKPTAALTRAASPLRAAGKVLTTEAVGGAAGEAASQVAAGNKLSPPDIAAEAIAELVTGPLSLVGGLHRQRGQTRAVAVASPSEATPEARAMPEQPTPSGVTEPAPEAATATEPVPAELRATYSISDDMQIVVGQKGIDESLQRGEFATREEAEAVLRNIRAGERTGERRYESIRQEQGEIATIIAARDRYVAEQVQQGISEPAARAAWEFDLEQSNPRAWEIYQREELQNAQRERIEAGRFTPERAAQSNQELLRSHREGLRQEREFTSLRTEEDEARAELEARGIRVPSGTDPVGFLATVRMNDRARSEPNAPITQATPEAAPTQQGTLTVQAMQQAMERARQAQTTLQQAPAARAQASLVEQPAAEPVVPTVMPPLAEVAAPAPQAEITPEPVMEAPEDVWAEAEGPQPTTTEVGITQQPPSVVRAVGKVVRAVTPRDTEVEFEYGLASAMDLVGSDLPGGFSNNAHPAMLQPRDQSRDAADQRVQTIKSKFDKLRALMPSRVVTEGPITVGPEGSYVEIGNNRKRAMEELYAESSQRIEDYRQELIERADDYGFTSQMVEDTPQPILVLRRKTPMSRESLQIFLDEANERTTAKMSATEQARTDISRITPDLVAMLDTDESGDLNAASNWDFIRAFVARVVPSTEHGDVLTGGGILSQAGVARVRNAILAYAYDSNELIENIAESADDNVRTVTAALVKTASKMAALRADIESGRLDAYNPADDIARAAMKLSYLRKLSVKLKRRITVEEYKYQTDPLEEPLTPFGIRVLEMFEEKKGSGKAIGDILSAYIDRARTFVPEKPGSVMPGLEGLNVVTTDPVQLLNDAIEKGDPAQQQMVFGEQPTETETENLPSVRPRNAIEKLPMFDDSESPAESQVRTEAGVHISPIRMPVEMEAQPGFEKGLPPTGLRRLYTRKGMPVGEWQIIERLSRLIDHMGLTIPIRTGKFRNKAEGIWKTHAQVVRTRKAHSPPAAVHEVFHGLLQLLPDFVETLPALARHELVRMGHQLYPDKKPTGGYLHEGWAEFGRHHLILNNVQALAPKTLKWFNETFLLNFPSARSDIAKIQKMSEAYIKQGAVNRNIGNEFPGETLLNKILHIGKRMPGDWVDELGPLQYVQDQAETLAPDLAAQEGLTWAPGTSILPEKRVSDVAHIFRGQASEHINYMVYNGVIDFNGHDRSEIRPLVEPARMVGRRNRKKFNAYLRAVHAREDLIPRGIDINITEKEANATISELEEKYPQFAPAAQMVFDWNRSILEYALQANPELAPHILRILKLNKFYVPTARHLSPEEKLTYGRLSRGTVRGGTGFYGIHGSHRPYLDPFPVMIVNAEKIIGASHKAYLVGLLDEYAQKIPGMGNVLEQVKPDMVPQHVTLEQIKDQLTEMGLAAEDVDNDVVLTWFTPMYQPKSGDPMVPIVRDGKMTWLYLRPDVFEAIYGGLDPINKRQGGSMLDMALNGAAALTRLARMTITGLNPGFSFVRNPASDLPTGLMQTTTGKKYSAGQLIKNPKLIVDEAFAQPWQYFQDWVKGMAIALDPRQLSETREPNPYLKAAEWIGVTHSQPLGPDIGISRRIAGGIFETKWSRAKNPKAWMNIVREIFSRPELGPRLGIEMAAARDTGTPGDPHTGWKPGAPLNLRAQVEVGLPAKRGTVDFSVFGREAKKVNPVVLFFNPNIQSVKAVYQALKNQPERVAIRGLMYLFLPNLVQWLRYKDEEWYQELENWERFFYFHEKIGEEVLHLKQPYEWGAMFSTLPIAMLDAAYRKDPKEVTAALDYTFKMLNPVDYPYPIVLGNEQRSNRVEWLGRPIVPEGQVEAPYNEQYGPYTTQFAKAVAGVFPKNKHLGSPYRIEHIIRGVLGGIGIGTLRTIEMGSTRKFKEPADIPVVGALFRRGGTAGVTTKSIQEFYNEFNRVKRRTRSQKPTTPEQDEYWRILQVTSVLLSNAHCGQRDMPAPEAREVTLDMTRMARNALQYKVSLEPSGEIDQVAVAQKAARKDIQGMRNLMFLWLSQQGVAKPREDSRYTKFEDYTSKISATAKRRAGVQFRVDKINGFLRAAQRYSRRIMPNQGAQQ